MRVAVEALDVSVSDADLAAVSRQVEEHTSSAAFKGASDLRVRLRNVKGALMCIVAVGFIGGDLVTSTATSATPLEATASALEALPARMERMPRLERDRQPTPPTHAAIREQLKRLLA